MRSDLGLLGLPEATQVVDLALGILQRPFDEGAEIGSRAVC